MFSQFVSTLAVAVISIFVYMSIVFVISVIIKRGDIADIAWGFGFIVASLSGMIFNQNYSMPALLVFAMVLIWGTRLGLHIGLRNIKKPEDFRYKEWRDSWGKWFNVRSFFQIFMFQGFLLVVIVSPVLLMSTYADGGITLALVLAVCLWIFGFVFESVGDAQLGKFLKIPQNKGRVMQNGLWRYTRHPNYFGEVTQWWAIGIAALSYKYGLLGLIGPFVITFLILKVSGVPMLEKKYANKPEYQEYKRKTSMFVPMPTKKLI